MQEESLLRLTVLKVSAVVTPPCHFSEAEHLGRNPWQRRPAPIRATGEGKEKERRARIPMYPSEKNLQLPTFSNLSLPPAVPATLQQRYPLETSPPAHEQGRYSRAGSQQMMLCLAPFVSISGPHSNKSKGIIPR